MKLMRFRLVYIYYIYKYTMAEARAFGRKQNLNAHSGGSAIYRGHKTKSYLFVLEKYRYIIL